MFHISHNDAIELEHKVRNLYGCDRGGVSGLVDADNFEHDPFQAMVLVVSFLYARGIVTEPLAFEELLHKYSVIFDYPDENNAKAEVRNYIEDVKKIVDDYRN